MSDETPTVEVTTAPLSEAREQAKEYDSIFAPTMLKLDDGGEIEVPPHPSLRMFDDEAMAEFEKLELEMEEECERHPDINVPEQKIYDAHGNLQMTLPPTTQRGPLKVPHRKKNSEGKSELLDPPYTVRVAKIALGEDYDRLRAGKIKGRKGSARDVWRIWNQQATELEERQRRDSKSAGGAVAGVQVPPPDKA